MALIDKASLLMVPSTYEAGTLYNVLPSGNRAPDSTDQNSGYDQTRADFDFDRGSNAAATRIGSDGLIKKYRENLLTYSNDFSNGAWTKFNASVTSGQSGYDGSSDAWLLNITTSQNSSLYRSISMSGVYTTSIYAKANSVDYLGIRDYSLSGAGNWFNLSNGTIASTTSDCIDAKIESVGNGWYRCSITQNRNATGYTQIGASDNPSTTSTTTGSIYIQSAQLETGLVATDYLDSGATTAKAGVLIDLPRINYDANGENGALLLEPQRANLVPYSEYFGGYFNVTEINLSYNYAISPDGTLNANKVKFPSTSNSMYKSGLSYSGAHSISFWYKGEGSNVGKTFDVRLQGTSANQNIDVTLESGWKRFEAQSDGLQTFEITNRSSTTIGAGSLLLYGFQIEAGSYATSYIPNHGTSSGVTRAADVCTGGGSAESINSTEGVLYAEISALADDFANYKFISLYDGTFDNFCDIYFGDASNRISVRVRSGGGSIINMFFAVSDVKAFHKVAISWKSNEFKFFVNGVSKGLNTSGAVPTGLNTLDFHQPSNGNPFYGNVKQVAVFNEALSDSELATLTTL